MIFKLRYAHLGLHIHGTLFAAASESSTFANLGDLVLRAGEEFLAFQEACPDIRFLQESLASLEGHRADAAHHKMSEAARQRWAKKSPQERQQVREKIAAGFARKKEPL